MNQLFYIKSKYLIDTTQGYDTKKQLLINTTYFNRKHM